MSRRRKVRLVLAAVGLWYALGLAHDLLVEQDAWYSLFGADVPFATVRCSGAAMNAIPFCVGDVRGPMSRCERAVLSGCDWAFPGGYLSQWVPRRPPVRRALASIELTWTFVAARLREDGAL